jgi:hypothetical protein
MKKVAVILFLSLLSLGSVNAMNGRLTKTIVEDFTQYTMVMLDIEVLITEVDTEVVFMVPEFVCLFGCPDIGCTITTATEYNG